MRRRFALPAAVLLVLVIAATACGRKGPLYLPPTDDTAEQTDTGNQD